MKLALYPVFTSKESFSTYTCNTRFETEEMDKGYTFMNWFRDREALDKYILFHRIGSYMVRPATPYGCVLWRNDILNDMVKNARKAA